MLSGDVLLQRQVSGRISNPPHLIQPVLIVDRDSPIIHVAQGLVVPIEFGSEVVVQLGHDSGVDVPWLHVLHASSLPLEACAGRASVKQGVAVVPGQVVEAKFRKSLAGNTGQQVVVCCLPPGSLRIGTSPLCSLSLFQ